MISERIKCFTKKTADSAPYVCLTAYSAAMATHLAPHVDLMLVGDSVATIIYGAATTREADMAMMVRHGHAVRRGAPDGLIVVDMPADSYDTFDKALHNARRLITETGCDAVKLEGGSAQAGIIAHLVKHDIAVMGHIGLLPQQVEDETGYKIKGKTEADSARLHEDALAVEKAGAFALVIEGVIEPVARQITQMLAIPAIGIGASAACDGQILVSDDMLGLYPGRKAKFVKQYADLGTVISEAAAKYAEAVKSRTFPTDDYLYHPAPKKAAS